MFRIASLAVAAGLVAAAPALAQDRAPGVQVGVLTCAVEGESSFIIGSTHRLGCNFKPASGAPVEFYSGTVSEFGLDIGTSRDATLVWGVLAPSADMRPGTLAGTYAGVTAGASLGVGLQANALVGGLDRSIALNPFSVESQAGTNLTLGVSRMTLTPIN
ncbi:DUF992 domain-containing protein [Polymorphum gilvum]|uniref:DUF992 domain-containing protein n=1 Tax=Polymorphum gilvum (strain LMG 25793 / CGMCC 1.9160 / SL003B-26A1) TaxID=991905 RepID=F2J0L1_POLGS|nr:DUF992 domain-containing protein [Polymorphum gilvum]ADZ69679.1 hypothetical protein SL003B_1250 [Polymorphum gilvum SL003B-26A1]